MESNCAVSIKMIDHVNIKACNIRPALSICKSVFVHNTFTSLWAIASKFEYVVINGRLGALIDL